MYYDVVSFPLLIDPVVQLHHLIFIGWKDEQGQTRKYYLTDKISHKWRDIGSFNGLSLSELVTISELFPNDPKECCRAVLGQWMDNPPPDYPTTWQGLLKLLKDSQLDQIVSELRNLLYKSPQHMQFKQEYKVESVVTNTELDLAQHYGKIIANYYWAIFISYTCCIGAYNLRDVEICGEVSVVATSHAQRQFEWEGYGLKLSIHKGSLPAGVEQCIISIKASLTGRYEFPKNCYLVSAIFWFRCETVREFVKPIIVELQHCAKMENTSNHNLSFVRAVCSQKQLPYTFKQLPGGNFISHSSYGVIELNSFSGVGVTREATEEREYYSRLVYLVQRSEVHFIVTWNVDAHLTVSVYCTRCMIKI